MVNDGDKLNARVGRVFQQAGFITKPNDQDASEEIIDLGGGKERKVDLSATIPDWKIKIIGENTVSPKVDEPITTYVHTLQELMKVSEAGAGLMVFSRKHVSREDIDYARDRRILIWGEDKLAYYEAVVDAIGTYARYEIINDFGLETQEENQISNVLAIKFDQPSSEYPAGSIYMFTMAPDKLLKLCVLYRRAQGNSAAYQRMLNKKRIASVRKFVTRQDAFMPPSVIVHLDDSVVWVPSDHPQKDKSGNVITLTNPNDYELGILQIPNKYASLELIDGQHRLFGFVATDPATKLTFKLSVLGLHGLSTVKRKNTFVSINDNSRRMDANLVAYLKYIDDEDVCRQDQELMAIKLVVELNKLSPFKGKVRLMDTGNQRLTLRGISGYDLKSLLGPRGLSRKHYANESSQYLLALRSYFVLVSSTFGVPWKNPDKYVIATNRGVSAFLKLLKAILRTCDGPIDDATVKKYLAPIKMDWPDPKWETRKLDSFVKTPRQAGARQG